MFTIPDNENIQNTLAWIVNYIQEENFSKRHVDAIAHIVGLFNDSPESEKEIFDFADRLYKRYAE